ncbi:MAG: GGDEF domain-containing protein [Agathobacter sp.]
MDVTKYNDIVQYWITQVMENRGKDAELSLKFCKDIVNYGMTVGDNNLIGFGYFYSGETYYLLNDGVHFFEEISKAMDFLNKAQDWELMGKCYNFLGIWATNRGNAPIALDYYLNGINYCQKIQLFHQEAIMNVNVGALNMQCGRYREAQAYLEKAYEYIKTETNEPGYDSYMVIIYASLAKAAIHQGNMTEAEEYFRRAYHDHWKNVDEMDRLTILCTEALYNHVLKDYVKRDHCIAQIQSLIHGQMPILDMSDDLYEYAKLLLDAQKEEEFWAVIDLLEPMIKNCNIIHMQLQIISLKIQLYRKKGQSAEYLQAAGYYYELSEIKEREMQEMINNVLNLRRSLESVNRARQEMEVQNRILLEKSEIDPLTKIANRFRLNDHSEEIFERVLRMESTIAVEMLDVDYFKEFNDNYGHQSGDGCLQAVADALREMTNRHNAFCARYGGDEFVIIYEDISYEEAISCAKELKGLVRDKNIPHKYSKAIPFVTISQGLCWGRPKEGLQMGDFLHTADSMLYKVKQKCRNNYCVGKIEDTENPYIGAIEE